MSTLGSSLLTGGKVGPEGSLSVYCYVVLRRRGVGVKLYFLFF